MSPEGPPPEELLARFREQGDVEALGALFDGTSPTLFRMALALAPDPASAEDAVQETFLTLMAPGSHYDPSRPLLPWMVGILQLKVHEARRRARRTVDPARLAPPVFPDDPARAAETGEEVERIRAALDALPEPYRAVAILRWRYGLEPAAIADARNEPPGTVRSLLHRAQEKLRGSLRLMPAFLLTERVPRGMDAVRSTVMTKGAVVAAAAAGASAAGVVAAGGLLMAPKMLAAGIAVLLLGGTAWFTIGVHPGRPIPTAPPPVAVAKPLPRLVERAPDPVATPLPLPGPVPGDLPPPVDLSKCNRDLDLFGTTVDEFGRPVPGAWIETVTYPWRRSGVASYPQYDEETVGLSARAAIDGTFCFRLSRGELVSLRATAEGYGDGYLERAVAGGRVTVCLRIGGAALAVTVLDEDRKGVPGANVRLIMRTSNVGGRNTILDRQGTTDPRGRCTFSHLPPGKAGVMIRHQTMGTPDLPQLAIPAGGTLPLDVVLYRGRTVKGRVTDASTGKPISGACVGGHWTQDRPVSTDSEGRFTLPGVAMGRVDVGVYVSAPGYGTQMRRTPDSGEVDFLLEPAFSAVGRVVSADGIPVQGSRVVVLGYAKGSDSRAYDNSMVISDTDGRFRVPDLSRRCPHHDLSIEAAGHGLVAWAFRSPPESDPELDLGDVPLSASRSIEGRAIDAAGNPVAGEDICVGRVRGPGDPKPEDPSYWAVPLSFCSRPTDDLGRFRFPDLSPGRWRVILSVPSTPTVEVQVDLTADGDITDLVVAQKGHALTLLVTDEGGNPIPGIAVWSDMIFPTASGSRAITAVTDAGGKALFRCIPDLLRGDPAGLRFQVQPYSSDPSGPPWTTVRTEPILPDGQVVHVVLQPVSVIRGRVLDPEGKPIAELLVHGFDDDGKPLAGAVCPCNDRGEFTLRVASGTTVTLKVTGALTVPAGTPGAVMTGYTPWRAELAGVRAPAEGIVLTAKRLAVDGALDVVVLDLDGKPVPGFEVNAWIAGDGRTGKTDGAGRVHWEGMIEGEWHMIPGSTMPGGSPEDAVPPSMVDFVPKGQELLLRFRRGIAVEGTVLLPDGTPAAGAILGVNHVQGGGGPARQPKADERGRFKLWFGEGDEFRIEAVWTDGKERTLRGETPEMRTGGPAVQILLAPE